MRPLDETDAILRNLRKPTAKDCRLALGDIRCVLVEHRDWSMGTLQVVSDILSRTFGKDWMSQTEADIEATRKDS